MQTRYILTLNLREPPASGKAQIVFRCLDEDRDLVTAAAALLGFSVNMFMRTVVIQAAKQVIHENNNPKPVQPKLRVKGEAPPGLMTGALPPGMRVKE